jgi:hypothetical protein
MKAMGFCQGRQRIPAATATPAGFAPVSLAGLQLNKRGARYASQCL